MDLLIKGKNIPKYCSQCICFHPELDVCKIDYCRTITTSNVFIKRPDSCPLREIPASHGRLIDADAMINRLKYLYCENCGNDCKKCPWGAFIKYIEGRPTIVDANQ